MYLDPKSTIAGIPALSIRKLFNKNDIISLSLITECFNISDRIAKTVINGLLDDGYLELNEFYSKHGDVCYHQTLKGRNSCAVLALGNILFAFASKSKSFPLGGLAMMLHILLAAKIGYTSNIIVYLHVWKQLYY